MLTRNDHPVPPVARMSRPGIYEKQKACPPEILSEKCSRGPTRSMHPTPNLCIAGE